jgi:DNA polymerase III subunit epsilon
MKLKEQRPLAIFDLETTGIDVTEDRIVEIAILKVNPDGTKEAYEKRVNPTIPIPVESSLVHGIYDKDIKDSATFKEIADEVAAFIGEADLAGYNSNKFDIPVLAEEFLRAGSSFDVSNRKFIDVQNIFHKMEQRTLVAAYKFYCEKDLVNAHSAMADVTATYEVLKAQLEKYEELEKSSDFLAEFTQMSKNKLLDFAGRIAENEKGEAIYNFGKHKGKSIAKVAEEEQGYYGWMMNSNFPLFTKEVLKREMEKIKKHRADNKKVVEAKKQEHLVSQLEALKSKFSK